MYYLRIYLILISHLLICPVGKLQKIRIHRPLNRISQLRHSWKMRRWTSNVPWNYEMKSIKLSKCSSYSHQQHLQSPIPPSVSFLTPEKIPSTEQKKHNLGVSHLNTQHYFWSLDKPNKAFGYLSWPRQQSWKSLCLYQEAVCWT